MYKYTICHSMYNLYNSGNYFDNSLYNSHIYNTTTILQ